MFVLEIYYITNIYNNNRAVVWKDRRLDYVVIHCFFSCYSPCFGLCRIFVVNCSEMEINMFEIGDKVFYGVVGVCEIEDIAPPPIKGIDGNYYYLQPVYDDKGIIYSPVESKKVSMRTIITKEKAQELLKQAENCKQETMLNEKVTPNQYDEMVKSQEAENLIHLIRALYNVKNERAKELRKMKSADSRMLAAARKLFYGEMAVALGKDYDEMCDLLDGYLSCQ